MDDNRDNARGISGWWVLPAAVMGLAFWVWLAGVIGGAV